MLDLAFTKKLIQNLLASTFNLTNGTYKSYKNPNDQLFYINKNSNHPLKSIKQLPRIISNILFRNSSNKEVFNTSEGEYKQTLKHRVKVTLP